MHFHAVLTFIDQFLYLLTTDSIDSFSVNLLSEVNVGPRNKMESCVKVEALFYSQLLFRVCLHAMERGPCHSSLALPFPDTGN